MDFRKPICLLMAICMLWAVVPAMAENDTDTLFDNALAALKTPAEIGRESMSYQLHPGESAYVPSIAPPITPYDERESMVYPAVNGSFESTDDAVVTVEENGLMTAVGEGTAEVVYHTAGGEERYKIAVSEDIPTEIAKNMAYVARREFYAVKRARLPKYNQYAKWYYGNKKEVGWCSVFGIWCANAAGSHPITGAEAAGTPDDATLYLRHGQVGDQYDGFSALDRFGGIPRAGYMVIYADMSNAYRTTHIGIVVDALEMGGGIYQVTTVEGNMSNSVKSYCYLYDSNAANNLVGSEANRKLQWNMSEVDAASRTDPLVQYEQHTDHWSVFGFCETWK